MRQIIINVSKRFEITLTDNQGDFVTGETINYEVRNSLTNSLEDSGTMTESPTGLYYFDYTFTTLGQYRILYDTPNGYSNEIEKIDVVTAPANADDVADIISEIDDNEAKIDIIDSNVDSIILSLSTLVADIWSYVTRTLTGIGTSGIASEANATTNTNDIISEIDANEVKIDALPTANDIADQVWDENLGDHLNSGTTGEALEQADATADPQAVADAVWQYNETGIGRQLTEGTRDAEIDAIKAKTDNLPVDPTSETNATTNKNSIITEVNANETKLDSIILTLSTLVADIWSYSTRTLTSYTTLVSDIWSYVTRELTGIGSSGIASESNATSNTNDIISEVDANEVKIDNLSTQLTNAESNIISEIDDNETKIDSIITTLSTMVSDIWSYVTRTLTGIGTSGIASEANATTNKNNIITEVQQSEADVIAEVNANETKIDNLSTQLTNAEANIVSEIDDNETKLDNLAIQITNAEGNIIGEIDANEIKIDALQSTINTMNQKLISIAGLVHDNSEVVDQVYDSNGNLTSATLRSYANIVDLQNQVNIVREYQLTATFDTGGLNTFFKMERTI